MTWLAAHRLALSFGWKAVTAGLSHRRACGPTVAAVLGLTRSVLTYHGAPYRKRRTARLYQRFVRPGDLVFDVGAHVGDRVVALRSLGARVLAVEPQPLFSTFLRRLFASDSHVCILGIGCGSSNYESVLRVSSAYPTLTTFSDTWVRSFDQHHSQSRIEWDATVEVPLRTLDTIIEEHGEPSFIKIDVEGLEAEVLRGLHRPVRALSVEFLPAAVEQAVESLEELTRLGDYQCNYSVAETMQLVRRGWLHPTQLIPLLLAMPRRGPSGDIYAVRVS